MKVEKIKHKAIKVACVIASPVLIPVLAWSMNRAYKKHG